MNQMQLKVAAFNQLVGAVRGTTPKIRAAELRARLILEEAFETVEALLGNVRAADVILDMVDQFNDKAPKCVEPDLVEVADGGSDLLFVTYGMFDACGIDAEPVFDLVYRANMTKANGPILPSGKRGKPPGFVPPNEAIRRYLESVKP